MQNEKFFLILALAALVSCQTKDNLKPADRDFPEDEIVTDQLERTSDVALTYLAENDFDAWVRIGSLEERFEACDPSQDLLEQMTTRALVESIARYPLNYLIYAYDNPEEAVNLIADRSPLHREFEKRADAARVLIDFVADTDIDREADVRMASKGKKLQLCDEMFLEYYMASDRLRETFTQRDSRRFAATVKSKLLERMSEPEVFSEASLKPLLKDAGLGTKASYGALTMHTRFGKRITVNRYPELSASEITYITDYYAQRYPNAQVLAPASSVYNDHSYAWYQQSTSNPYWIYPYDASGNYQLSRFWTKDYYVACTSSDTPERAYYDTSNPYESHSAVIRADGKYVSKWGQGPLMVHNAADCPFQSSNIKKYRRVSSWLPMNNLSLSGPEHMEPGETKTFSRGRILNTDDVTYRWSIKNYQGVPNYQDAAITGPGNTDVQVTAYSPGAFEIRVDAYAADYPNEPFSYGFKTVVVYPTH